MHGTLSDERIMIPGESVNFLQVWMQRLQRLDERRIEAERRGMHDAAECYAGAYEEAMRGIDTYVEALWQSGALDRAGYAAAARARRQG